MKIFYQGRRINGRYDTFKATLRRTFYFTRKWTLIGAAAYAIFLFGQIYTSNTMAVAFAETKVVDVLPEKIAGLKAQVVETISDCERAGHSEADGLIVFDSNSKASIGVMQFQVKTVMHYEKTLYGKDISGKDAILIALDADQAKALATDIIFKADGLGNWLNCANKYQLRTDVNFIAKLSK